MHAFESWLATRGPAVALMLEERREPICEYATARFGEQFFTLMLDNPRPDAEAFQRMAFRETPRRFHRLLQVALRFQTLAVIDREYRWSWGILPRFGITLGHLQAMARHYFEGVRVHAPMDTPDRIPVDMLERSVLNIIERSAPVDLMRVHLAPTPHYTNGHTNGHAT